MKSKIIQNKLRYKGHKLRYNHKAIVRWEHPDLRYEQDMT